MDKKVRVTVGGVVIVVALIVAGCIAIFVKDSTMAVALGVLGTLGGAAIANG